MGKLNWLQSLTFSPQYSPNTVPYDFLFSKMALKLEKKQV
jgi:hypothetical protein